MRDKYKCYKCKYHSYLGTIPKDKPITEYSDLELENIVCYYSILSHKSCALKKSGKHLIDRRGKDPKNCLLYEEGVPENRNKKY